jgi:hypothetical protein
MHGIETFEDDQLRPLLPRRAQKLFEMGKIVMAENLPLRLGAADAFDHRIVVVLIRKNEAIRQEIADRGNRRKIGNPARRSAQEQTRPIPFRPMIGPAQAADPGLALLP